MNLSRTILFTAVILIISGCVTPAGQLTDQDFESKSINSKATVSEAVSNFYEGLRFCGPSSGGLVFVTHHGVPDCAPIRPDGSASCDLYVGGVFSPSSNVVLGRADFHPSNNGSVVTLRVINFAAGKEEILAAWELMVNGNPEQVCKKG